MVAIYLTCIFSATREETVRVEKCNDPCTSMEVTFGYVIPDISNKAKLKIYFSSLVKVQQSRYTYDIINFMGEIGGYVGLLLGVSVLNLDRVIDSLLRMFKSKKIKLTRNSRSRRSKRRHGTFVKSC